MYLQLAGYSVYELGDAVSTRKAIHERLPSLVLTGIMLPGEDGFSLGHSLIRRGIPVVFLTAKATMQDRITGLKMGAQDYIVHPMEPSEFLARIENVLKHCRQSNKCYEYRGLRVDFDARKVWQNGHLVKMTTLEFDLLKALICSEQTAMTRDELLAAAWGTHQFSNKTRTVDMHIRRLRGKIGADRIETIVKYGYRFHNDS